ncbi:MAG: hypothetical protein AMXMBFR84_29680 [Candidatus Hydrogenedentota bacterium]
MSMQRTAALCLMLVQAVAAGVLSGQPATAAILFLLVLPGYAGWVRWKASPIKTGLAAIAIVSILMGRWWITPEPTFAEAGTHGGGVSIWLGGYKRYGGFGDSSLSATLSLVFLGLQAIPFYSIQNVRAFHVFPLLGVLTLVFAGNVNITPDVAWLYQSSVILFVLGLAWFASASKLEPGMRRRRWNRLGPAGVMGTTLIVASVLGSHVLSWAGPSIDEFLFARGQGAMRGAIGGFSGRSNIENLREYKEGAGADLIALRVQSKNTPGYLRGMAFALTPQGQWRTSDSSTTLAPESRPPVGISGLEPGANLFRIMTVNSETYKALTVWPVAQFGRIFLPKDSAYVAVRSPSMEVDGSSVSNTPMGEAVSHYTSYVPDAQVTSTLTESERALYSTPVEGIDPRIQELANTLFADADTAQEKITAVKQFLGRGFRYTTEYEVLTGEDKLVYFLLHRRAGHCEYFAHATDLLLRAGGVPSRYILGFYATEYNVTGEYWIARNKDSHAWVEAYDDAQSEWVIVETTPGDGIPSSTVRSAWSYRWDAVKLWLSKTVALVSERAFNALAEGVAYAVVFWLDDLPVRGLAGGLALFLIVFALARSYLAKRRDRIQADPLKLRAEQMVERMDRLSAHAGCVRGQAETLNQFAARVRTSGGLVASEEIAAWYEHFALKRFSGALDGDSASELEQRVERICAQSLRRHAS